MSHGKIVSAVKICVYNDNTISLVIQTSIWFQIWYLYLIWFDFVYLHQYYLTKFTNVVACSQCFLFFFFFCAKKWCEAAMAAAAALLPTRLTLQLVCLGTCSHVVHLGCLHYINTLPMVKPSGKLYKTTRHLPWSHSRFNTVIHW